MRFAYIEPFEVVNGKGIGVSLWVTGCPFHCKGCHNKELQDSLYGTWWNEEAETRFFKYVNRDGINRVTFIGGEPLAKYNRYTVLELAKKCRELGKEVWIYTGYELSEIDFDITGCFDVLVDGRYIELLNMGCENAPFRGSTNQVIYHSFENYVYTENGKWFKFENNKWNKV